MLQLAFVLQSFSPVPFHAKHFLIEQTEKSAILTVFTAYFDTFACYILSRLWLVTYEDSHKSQICPHLTFMANVLEVFTFWIGDENLKNISKQFGWFSAFEQMVCKWCVRVLLLLSTNNQSFFNSKLFSLATDFNNKPLQRDLISEHLSRGSCLVLPWRLGDS